MLRQRLQQIPCMLHAMLRGKLLFYIANLWEAVVWVARLRGPWQRRWAGHDSRARRR
jgi:hypothetical protein